MSTGSLLPPYIFVMYQLVKDRDIFICNAWLHRFVNFAFFFLLVIKDKCIEMNSIQIFQLQQIWIVLEKAWHLVDKVLTIGYMGVIQN